MPRRAALAERFALYESHRTGDEIERIQLEDLNRVWDFCLSERAFYRHWRATNRLPREFISVSQLQDFPMLTKSDLNEHQDLVFAECSSANAYTTGGSTSEPTKFPRDASEDLQRYASNYVGRMWWGIAPNEPRILLWGHSHLYGTGFGGQLRKVKQGLKDSLTRTYRLNGYVTDVAKYGDYVNALLHHKPTHVVGYASALTRLAYAVDAESRSRIAALNLKGIIATADTLSLADEEAMREAFNCPVIIEYGAAEAGVIAVSRQTTHNIQVLWDQHILRQSAQHGVLITSIKPRLFPLINYALGDSAAAAETSPGGSVLAISAIQGRLNEVVSIANRNGSGSEDVWLVHFTHIIKSFGGVRAVQYEQRENDALTVYVDVDPTLDRSLLKNHVRSTFHHELPQLDTESISWDFETAHQRSVSGKHLNLRQR